jgi:hypothetical protein
MGATCDIRAPLSIPRIASLAAKKLPGAVAGASPLTLPGRKATPPDDLYLVSSLSFGVIASTQIS